MRIASVLILAVALLASACQGADEPTDSSRTPFAWATPTTGAAVQLPACDWAKVISVHDGDTIRVSISDGPYLRLRYIGIDAPEVASQNGPEEPFGHEATERNRELVEGKEICLEKDVSDVDQFDRLLRYAWLADGRMVEEVLLAEGLARVVTFRPDTKYHKSRLSPVEAKARESELGIWGE